MTSEKRRKTPAASKCSRIFAPFRALGMVSEHIPFALGTLGGTFYIVTSVGRSFQIYDAATLHLLFVSQEQTPARISALAAHFHYVYAAYGDTVGLYRRGRLDAQVRVLLSGAGAAIRHVLVFGDYLAALATDGTLAVFRRLPGSKLHTEHYTTITSIDPQYDGAVVGLIHPPTYLNKVVVATASSLFVVNVHTAKVVFKTQPQLQQERISCIEYAPALDIVALGTATGGVYVYNLKQARVLGGRITASVHDVAARVVALSFRTDGLHHLVAALSTGDLYFHDLAKDLRVHLYRNCHAESSGGVANARFLNSQPIVVTNGADNQLKELVFDPPLSASNTSVISPPRHLRSRGGHSASPVALIFPNEEKSHFIYSAAKDQTLWCFSMRKDAQAQEVSQRPPKSALGERRAGPVALLREKFPEITAVAMSVAREGQWDNMLTTHKNETFARTWNTQHKRVGQFQFYTVDGGIAKAVCVSHCGNFGLVGSLEGGIGVYNLQSGLLRRKYMLHKRKAVTGLAIDGMNRKMVSCGLDGIVGFYNFADSTYLGKLQLDEPITSMIYHKGSDLVACALDDLSIVVIDVVTQKVVRVLYGHTNRITGMDFLPDGRWIVSASLDGTLRTWDLPTGGCIDGIRLPSVATNVKFSPIGDFLATTHVSGNGISLWTNRAQFHPVLTRHMDENDFLTVLLPNVSGDGGLTMLDGALEAPDAADIDLDLIYQSVDQISADLVTLAVGPRTKYQTVVHLDTIKKRNKPKERVKKPKLAPFFLALSGEAVGDRASVAENGKSAEVSVETDEEGLRLLKLKSGAQHNFESKFTQLLREGGESGDYTAFLAYLNTASTSTLDLEIRVLNLFPPLMEMTNFVAALTAGLRSNTCFDMYQAIAALFFKHHGDVVDGSADDNLKQAVADWTHQNAAQCSRLDHLVKYCSGVLDFVTTV
ncbi:Utp21-domain-containing protein [Metschnikowia bicuspidata]|uniref:Utp21-domain-containing protein n=1 Tax=Metschnikowia bicuspidata TaxID=27322 RepID=A0A4P9Z9J2_9ASCO|nr:Utp21-domain-containing protein [Metschnikowia bicuspidata]